MRRFSAKTVWVTGASQGVGLAVCQGLLAEGANVVMVARRPGPLEVAAKGLDAPERVLCHAADVTDDCAMQDVLDQTLKRFGSLNGLVNNAGAHHRGPVRTRSADELGQMVDVNLRAPVTLSRRCLPHLLEHGGFIVNVASLAGKLPLEGAATYSATKFGLRAFTIALAQELRDTGVRVSVVSPGPIDTPFIMDNLDEVTDITFSQTLCSAGDVAAMVLDCATDGRIEREFPVLGGKLATLGYLWPSLRGVLKPLLEAKGRRVKDGLRARKGQSGQ
jgi:hypothetical protein